MKVKRMGITEILRRIWQFSANTAKSSESFNKQPTQLIVKLNTSLQQIVAKINTVFLTASSMVLKVVFCYQNCSSDRGKLLKFEAEG